MVQPITDTSLMPFGAHKGVAMANVPASYLLWIYDNLNLRQDMKDYIKANLEALKAELKRAAREKNR